MKQNPGGTDSPWKASDATRQLPSLDADLQTDVCIVGGGISGMTTAYLLAREGRCPCHGSRFDKLGHVINGPANSDLLVH